MTPNYKLQKKMIHYSKVPFSTPCKLKCWAQNQCWPQGCERLQYCLHTLIFRTGYPSPLKSQIWNSQRRPKGFFQHNINWNCIFSFSFFFFQRNHALIHISKIITTDPRHLSCCHWNLGKVILVVLQVTNKHILLETKMHVIQDIPEGKIEVHWL